MNVRTGKRIHPRLPDLRHHYMFGPIVGGLLVLCRKGTHVVQLLNPVTGQLTNLPLVTALLPSYKARSIDFRARRVWLRSGSGVADDSTVALLCNSGHTLVVAKPGDDDWTRLSTDDDCILLALPLAGRLYCVTNKNILVVETAANQKARLSVVAGVNLASQYPLARLCVPSI
ncbi:hypothetical protein EJB05_11690, partial [Eragrostis curvula]